MKVYVVTWSRAIGGDEIPTDCFCGCVGTFTSLAKAKDCMRQDVDSTILDIKDGFEEQDDLETFESTFRYSDEDFAYEFEYEAGDGSRVQFYYSVQESEVEE
jgi:hypothetical protein